MSTLSYRAKERAGRARPGRRSLRGAVLAFLTVSWCPSAAPAATPVWLDYQAEAPGCPSTEELMSLGGSDPLIQSADGPPVRVVLYQQGREFGAWVQVAGDDKSPEKLEPSCTDIARAAVSRILTATVRLASPASARPAARRAPDDSALSPAFREDHALFAQPAALGLRDTTILRAGPMLAGSVGLLSADTAPIDPVVSLYGSLQSPSLHVGLLAEGSMFLPVDIDGGHARFAYVRLGSGPCYASGTVYACIVGQATRYELKNESGEVLRSRYLASGTFRLAVDLPIGLSPGLHLEAFADAFLTWKVELCELKDDARETCVDGTRYGYVRPLSAALGLSFTTDVADFSF